MAHVRQNTFEHVFLFRLHFGGFKPPKIFFAPSSFERLFFKTKGRWTAQSRATVYLHYTKRLV